MDVRSEHRSSDGPSIAAANSFARLDILRAFPLCLDRPGVWGYVDGVQHGRGRAVAGIRQRRSDTAASTRLWLRSVALFGVSSALAGVGLIVLGPWATSVLSNGQLVASRGLAIAIALLLVVQCIHLPGGVMLTMPSEMRWQSHCLLAMGASTVVLGVWWADGGAARVLWPPRWSPPWQRRSSPTSCGFRLLRRRVQELATADEPAEAAIADRDSSASPTHYTRTRNDLGRMERRYRENAANGGLAGSRRR